MHIPLYIVWNDRMLIDISILDEQHRGMLATINTLYYFICQGWGLQALKPTLDIIQRYGGFHAKTEEGLLTRAEYPEIQRHVLTYKRFLTDTNAAVHDAINEREPEILLRVLKQWWTNHLEIEHRQFADYFRRLA
ncbi:MAG: chemotaxis protein [Gammaproteobacteria bacterium]|nr:chemotaxis protein [Gammaproteobacteria bacterium]